MAEELTLRDFIYLDIDKVRSFVAQSHQGVPEVTEETKAREKGAGGKGGFTLPFLGEVGIGGQILYQSSTTETKSAHHYLYNLLEQKLSNLGKLVKVNESFDVQSWGTEAFKDGSFVLVKGIVRLIDFPRVVNALQALPKFLDVASRFYLQNLQERLNRGEINQQEYNRLRKTGDTSSLDKKDIKALAEMVETLYAKSVRVKVFPFDNKRDYYFVGNAHYENFQEQPASLFSAYRAESGAKWFAMGQVNTFIAPQISSFEALAAAEQNMEDALEQMVFAMQEVGKLSSPVDFPAISFAPISIYRSC